MRWRVSDRAARWTGRVTIGTIVATIAFFLFVGFSGTELTWLSVGFGIRLFIFNVVGAWLVARVVMALHQHHSDYLKAEDKDEWTARELGIHQDPTELGVDALFLGPLVPFIYLLASPEQRQLTIYLKPSKRSKRKRAMGSRLISRRDR